MNPPRIDSHQHFWRYAPAEYGWIDDRMATLRRDFLPADLAPLLVGSIDGTIAVQARQSVQETRWLLDLASRHPWICAVVGWVDLRSPRCAHQLDDFARDPRLRGIRHVLQDEPEEYSATPEFRRGIAELDRRHLVYDLLVRPALLDRAIDLCRAFPGLTCVLDHLGKPDIRGGGFGPWRQRLRRLAALPNVHCKLSGLATEADWSNWRADDLRPYALEALEAFGPERVLFGSDWPVCLLAVDYPRWQAIVDQWLTGSEAVRRAVFGGNAVRAYRVRVS